MSRPFIHVNCAMSADGKLAGPERKQVRISGDKDISRVKELRRKYNGILVGIGTVIADDPHLTVKGTSREENPVRVVLDTHGRTPADARVLDDLAQTVIVTCGECRETWDGKAAVIRAGKERIDLGEALRRLRGEFGVETLLVEGGGEVIASFFRERFVDRYTVFVGPVVIGGKTSPTPTDGDGWAAPGGIRLDLESCEQLGNGVLLTFVPEY